MKLELEIKKLHKTMQTDFEKKLAEIEAKRYESPSILDTGIEHDSPEKKIRPSAHYKGLTEFSKDFKL